MHIGGGQPVGGEHRIADISWMALMVFTAIVAPLSWRTVWIGDPGEHDDRLNSGPSAARWPVP